MITLNEFLIKKHTEKGIQGLPIYARVEDNKYTAVYCYINSLDTYKNYEHIIIKLSKHNDVYLNAFNEPDTIGIVLLICKYSIQWNRIIKQKDNKLYSRRGTQYVQIPDEYVDETTLTYDYFQELYNKYVE